MYWAKDPNTTLCMATSTNSNNDFYLQIPRFFTNLENNLNYNIGKVRAVKFTLYIILITHISGCVWFLDACFGKT